MKALLSTPIDTPAGGRVPLKAVASVVRDTSPNTITREGVQRKMVVHANVADRDIVSVVTDMRAAVKEKVVMPGGYYPVFGGQFESAALATRTIGLLSLGVIAGIFLLLGVAFRSVRNALLTLVNLPLALIGGVLAVAFTSGVVSIPALVGFITLFGIATRNGIMMISQPEHLIRDEGKGIEEAVRQGPMERLAPILMTALCAGLALIPLVLGADEPGTRFRRPWGWSSSAGCSRPPRSTCWWCRCCTGPSGGRLDLAPSRSGAPPRCDRPTAAPRGWMALRGHATALRGQPTALRGHATALRGHTTALRGHATALRGRTTALRGHTTALRGQPDEGPDRCPAPPVRKPDTAGRSDGKGGSVSIQ